MITYRLAMPGHRTGEYFEVLPVVEGVIEHNKHSYGFTPVLLVPVGVTKLYTLDGEGEQAIWVSDYEGDKFQGGFLADFLNAFYTRK